MAAYASLEMSKTKKDLEEANDIIAGSDATLLDCQVAGHSARKGSLDFLKHKEGYVLKPVLTKEDQGRREVDFYEEVSTTTDPVIKQLQNFLPEFYGTTRVKGHDDDVKWIVLKNAAHEFREPCVMDVKIGARTWDPLATEEKRASEEAKYRACKRDLGFCIPGFQVYDINSGKLVRRDRAYGKSLDGLAAKSAIRMFLNGDSGLCRSLVLQFLAKLWKILRWFRTQTKYQFYSSSLLLAYDAAKLKRLCKKEDLSVGERRGAERPTIGRQLSLRAVTGPLTPGFPDGPSLPGPRRPTDDWHAVFDEVCKTHSLVNNYEADLQTMKENYELVLKDLMERDGKEEPELWANVHMIDFAHVFRSNSGEIDHNYLSGLQNLVDIFEECLEDADF